MQTTSQKKNILRHLRRGWKLTPLTALEKYECFRLAARIADLRKDGHDIRTKIIEHNGTKFAEYRLGQ